MFRKTKRAYTESVARRFFFPEGRRATIVIDQHGSDKPVNADLSIINLHCGATSVILAQALFASRRVPPPQIATASEHGLRRNRDRARRHL